MINKLHVEGDLGVLQSEGGELAVLAGLALVAETIGWEALQVEDVLV